MRLPIVFLFLFAITTEYWLDVGIASMKSSILVAVIYVLFHLKETIFILKTESNTFIIYIYIMIGILINDLYVDAETTDIFKSVFFHISSVIIFIFFFSLFSKDKLNFPKFMIIFGCALIIYKNGEFFFDISRLFDGVYFSARLASTTVNIAIGWSFFLILKYKNFRALFVLLFSTWLLYSTDTRSYGTILLMTLIMFFVTTYTKINFRSFLAFIVLLFPFSIFGLFYFAPEVISTIVIARLGVFSSLMHFFNTFPMGIGSGGVVNLFPYKETLSNYFGFPLIFNLNPNYTTAHSFIVGALFKHGVLTLLPLSYFLISIINLNIKMISFKNVSNEQKLISIFIINFTIYSMFFSGYQIFLIQFPMYYALTLSMFNRINAEKP